MSTLKLTDAAVKRLKAPDPSGKQVIHWDSEHRGFGVLCSGVTKDSKTWVVQSRFNGRTKRLKVGPTDRYDRDAAWEKGRPILNDIEDGKDPKAEKKRQAQTSVTVEQVLEKYLAQPRLAASSVAIYRALARKNLSPWLQRPLRSITGDDVEVRFAEISKDIARRQASGQTKGGVKVTGAASANQSLQLFGTLWNYQAERDETLGRSPISRLRKQWHVLHRRDRRLWDQDFPQFYQAVMALPNLIHRNLILFGLFTGLRENEAQRLSWEEVDLRHKVIRLPAERMKNREPLQLPMSSFVHALLVARRSIGYAGPFVFPRSGKKKGHTQSFAFALGQIKEATGLQLSPHDLRRTFISVASNSEISSVAKKRLVGHTTAKGDVTDGYTILSDADVQRAAERVCAKIVALCGIEAPQAGNVTKLG